MARGQQPFFKALPLLRAPSTALTRYATERRIPLGCKTANNFTATHLSPDPSPKERESAAMQGSAKLNRATFPLAFG
ncbi:hypothetical protein FACS1894156_1990 [Bacteroidia bacterium]|nr:hypothetical protein FACS1894156_1990 [Bacteroidia bacterium]